MAKKSVTAPPKEALPAGEANPYLMKFKSSLCNHWSLTRMDPVYEMADLALFLWALDRNAEALGVAVSIAGSIPSPPPLPRGRFNYDVWHPATFSHGLVVHLGTGKWRDQAETSCAAILSDAGIARNNPGYVANEVSEARQLAAAPTGQDTIKWECQRLARTLGPMVLYCELAKAGDTLFKPHSKAVALIIPQLLSKLQARLRNAK